MSTNYKGITVPEYTDAADGPAAFRASVDSGPIPRFASTADRDTAIPSPAHGQMVFLSNGADYTWYDGTQWKALLEDSSLEGHKHSGADITSGTVGAAYLPLASTGAPGIVKLNPSTSSDSTTEAATPSAVREAMAAGDHPHPYLWVGGGTMSGPLIMGYGSSGLPSIRFPGMPESSGIFGNSDAIAFSFQAYWTLACFDSSGSHGNRAVEARSKNRYVRPLNLLQESGGVQATDTAFSAHAPSEGSQIDVSYAALRWLATTHHNG